MAIRASAVEKVVTDKQFWRGKKVLVTGHTGFKGSWLSLWLQELGADVAGLSLAPTAQPNLFEAANVEKGMTSIIGDIRDLEYVKDVFQEVKPEIVIHMAAQALVRYSYDNPVETYGTNVMGTLHVLEAIRNVKTVRSVVMVTTDKCYENKEWSWAYREYEPMGGHDPYSSSKGCMELLVASYRNSFFPLEQYSQHRTAIASARAGNVIGGGDWSEDRLIPDVMRAINAGQSVKIRSPKAIRPWQHVLEPLSGYLLLAERLYSENEDFSSAWNFGPADEDAKPVDWIVNYLIGATPAPGAGFKFDEGEQPHEAHYLKLDSSKAKALLGWKVKWSLEEALDKVVEWNNQWRNDADMQSCCFAQISAFSNERK